MLILRTVLLPLKSVCRIKNKQITELAIKFIWRDKLSPSAVFSGALGYLPLLQLLALFYDCLSVGKHIHFVLVSQEKKRKKKRRKKKRMKDTKIDRRLDRYLAISS